MKEIRLMRRFRLVWKCKWSLCGRCREGAAEAAEVSLRLGEGGVDGVEGRLGGKEGEEEMAGKKRGEGICGMKKGKEERKQKKGEGARK